MLKRKPFFLLLLLVIIGLACTFPAITGSGIHFGPTETPTPLPTATPLPSPTPTPTLPPAARINLAEGSLFNGDYDKAMEELTTALNSASDVDTKASAQLGIGRTLYFQHRYNDAVQALKAVTDANPDSNQAAIANFIMGQAYTDLKLWQEAADSYASYLHIRPGILDAYVQELRGDALTSAENYTEALTAYQAALQASPLNDSSGIEVKIGKSYSAMGDDTNALRTFMAIYQKTTNDYMKSQMNLLSGQVYLRMGLQDQAYARFQDSVKNYPLAYDSYSALVALVDNDVSVDDLDRGLTDYYAGQYAVAIEAFNRYLKSTPKHDGTVHHYKALSMQAMGNNTGAISEWNALISDHAGDRFYVKAYEEKAYTQWAYLDQYPQAAQTLFDFVKRFPTAAETPDLLFDAGRILERGNRLTEAAATWERLINEYPTYLDSYRALFLAGITQYRLGSFDKALTTFQRVLVLSSVPYDQSTALFWMGKTYQSLKNVSKAKETWEQAAQTDPTGYYSERAREVLFGLQHFSTDNPVSLDYDLKQERHLAELWMHTNFTIPPEVDLNTLGPLADDPRVRRGDELCSLGLYDEAGKEFEDVRTSLEKDATALFRFLNHLVDLGFYRSAVLTSRQILTLAGMDDAATFTAPNYFNHIRFGAYFRDIVVDVAQKEDFQPLFLFSVIRQESLFEGFIHSSAGAIGLMQIIPATGQEISSSINWPPDFTTDDLYRPLVSVRLGGRYLARQRDYFQGDLYATLAAYNAGPGNAEYWKKLAPNDQDLFLEVIRYDETRKYITQISEFMNLYRRMYEKGPQ
jgi:soluble lytic murein transglycosylase